MINIILTLIALIPMTIFLYMVLWGVLNITPLIDSGETLFLITMIFWVCGNIGLIMNLKQSKKRKSEVINFILLFFGVIGLFMFSLFENGWNLWNWIFTTRHPLASLIFALPFIIKIFLTGAKAKQLRLLYK